MKNTVSEDAAVHFFSIYIILSPYTHTFLLTVDDHGESTKPTEPRAASGAAKASVTGAAALFAGALMIL